MPTATIRIKVDESLRERIQDAARHMGRTPHWLIGQAVIQYVDALERGASAIWECPAASESAVRRSLDRKSVV